MQSTEKECLESRHLLWFDYQKTHRVQSTENEQLDKKAVTYAYATWATNLNVSISLLLITRLYNMTNMQQSFIVKLLSIAEHVHQVAIRKALQEGGEVDFPSALLLHSTRGSTDPTNWLYKHRSKTFMSFRTSANSHACETTSKSLVNMLRSREIFLLHSRNQKKSK